MMHVWALYLPFASESVLSNTLTQNFPVSLSRRLDGSTNRIQRMIDIEVDTGGEKQSRLGALKMFSNSA